MEYAMVNCREGGREGGRERVVGARGLWFGFTAEMEM